MGWVQRGGFRFYCRSVRKGRRVLREYYGSGVEAQLAAAVDQERQRQRQVERESRQQAQQAWDAARSPLDELIAVTNVLTEATLLVGGYHRHHAGAWRKRHGQNR